MTRLVIGATFAIVMSFCVVNLASATVDPDLSYYTTAATGPASVYSTPNGQGLPFTQAFLFGGAITDATITLVLIDTAGDPIPNYPREDLWLVTSLGGLLPCGQGTIADADTDSNGETTFSGPIYAGGYTNPDAGELTYVLVDGNMLNCPGVDLQFNGPDLDRDMIFNLSDVPLMVDAIFEEYNYALDIMWDGEINLSDVSLLGQMFLVSYGAGCP